MSAFLSSDIFCPLVPPSARCLKHMAQLSRFFQNSPYFQSILLASQIGLKSSKFFRKWKTNSHKKKIFCITKYYLFMFLSLSFKLTHFKKQETSFRCLPLKYFSLFIYNNCVTLHLAWLVEYKKHLLLMVPMKNLHKTKIFYRITLHLVWFFFILLICWKI